MRDYVREMMDTWTHEGEQAAHDLGIRLLKEIEDDYGSRPVKWCKSASSC